MSGEACFSGGLLPTYYRGFERSSGVRYAPQMTRRYPTFASPQELAGYIALEGSVIPEELCIERVRSIVSLRRQSFKTPTPDLSWGWILGCVVAILVGFPLVTPFITVLVAAATAATGLVGAFLQLRPILAALNPHNAVSWFGPFVSEENEVPGPLLPDHHWAFDESLKHLEYEHEAIGESDVVSPVRTETKAHVTVGFGSIDDKPGQLRAVDAFEGLSSKIRGQIFRGRRDLFQDLARRLLPDVFVQTSTVAMAAVLAALAISLEGSQAGWAVALPRLAQVGLGLLVGRSVSSVLNTLSWWRDARENWERRALEERLVAAAVAGVPDRVLVALAEKEHPIGRSFVTPDEYARQWKIAGGAAALGRPNPLRIPDAELGSSKPDDAKSS